MYVCNTKRILWPETKSECVNSGFEEYDKHERHAYTVIKSNFVTVNDYHGVEKTWDITLVRTDFPFVLEYIKTFI